MNGLCTVAAFMAGATGISCSTGVYDGNYEGSVTRTIAFGKIDLMEASLDVSGCLVPEQSAEITLRRFLAIAHSGARSAVFEIEISRPDAFLSDPKIEIMALPSVLRDKDSKIGFLVPGDDQWIPDQDCSDDRSSPIACFDCSPAMICGGVQMEGFTKPVGKVARTSVMDFAIVHQCKVDSECPNDMRCNSRACQQCPEGSCS